MNRAVRGAVGLGLAVILSAPASAFASDSGSCRKYSHVQQDVTESVISSVPVRICSVDIVSVGAGPDPSGIVQLIDSPTGAASHGQARYVLEKAVDGPKKDSSTGRLDRITEFGLSVTTANADAFISWEEI